MKRRVHLHQFAEATPSRSSPTMAFPTPLSLPKTLCQKPTPQSVDRDDQTLRRQLLAREGRAEIRITPTIGLQHFFLQHPIVPMIGGLAAQAMHQGAVSFLLPTLLQTSQLSHRKLDQFSSFDLAEPTLFDITQNTQAVPFSLTHLDPVSFLRHSPVLLAQGQKRTFLLA
jgi:hypothetical protein